MSKQKISSLAGLLVAVAALGIPSGRAYIDAQAATYAKAAPCGRLPGVAGMLQAAHFLPQGDCASNPSTGVCTNNASCTISGRPSGSPTKGKCTTVTSSGKNSCVCVAL